MSVHSSQRKRRRDNNRLKFKGVSHNEFLLRIKKTLYYGEMPVGDTFSLPVTEFAAELYSKVKAGRSLERLRLEEAAEISHNTCVSPCCLVLAMLYLDRLKTCNPAYLNKAVPSELFLISAMVANKFLNDDGEEDEVINCEWAASAGLDLKDVNHLEKEFLKAIDWHVFVKDTSFWSRLRSMERDIALKEGKRRGWFSYTELENLLDSLDIITLAQTIVAVSHNLPYNNAFFYPLLFILYMPWVY
ncbi:hypothetical protein AAG570_000145 [Ranatra chinensis]|uniref:Protein CNPPD1 n=1 Tax=Ranatra chinensis TaxID=642074 RepID=A0ABD0ZHF9_9HEMI